MKPLYRHYTKGDVFFGQVHWNGLTRDLYHTPLGHTIPEYPFIIIRSCNITFEYVVKSLENIRNIPAAHPDAPYYAEIVRQYEAKNGTNNG